MSKLMGLDATRFAQCNYSVWVNEARYGRGQSAGPMRSRERSLCDLTRNNFKLKNFKSRLALGGNWLYKIWQKNVKQNILTKKYLTLEVDVFFLQVFAWKLFFQGCYLHVQLIFLPFLSKFLVHWFITHSNFNISLILSFWIWDQLVVSMKAHCIWRPRTSFSIQNTCNPAFYSLILLVAWNTDS